ncbi:hypothetical protein DFP73DRAFT_532344 [Morchella snyderi]|nr:hypothetical protein DFP73DRAFT_532344 [Morchella snyderi]
MSIQDIGGDNHISKFLELERFGLSDVKHVARWRKCCFGAVLDAGAGGAASGDGGSFGARFDTGAGALLALLLAAVIILVLAEVLDLVLAEVLVCAQFDADLVPQVPVSYLVPETPEIWCRCKRRGRRSVLHLVGANVVPRFVQIWSRFGADSGVDLMLAEVLVEAAAEV